MIDTREPVITEALAVIDKALAEMLRRELVSAVEVGDLLLDLRSLLTASAATTSEAEGSVECVGGMDDILKGNDRCRTRGNAPAGAPSAKETVNAELPPRLSARRFSWRL